MRSTTSSAATQELPATRITYQGADSRAPVQTPLARVVPPELRASQAFLTMLEGPEPGKAYPILSRDLRLGRDARCVIAVDDPAVSREHARLLRLPSDVFVLEDLGSTNGTFVRARRVADSVQLEQGDRVQLGPNVCFRFGFGDDVELALQQQLYASSNYDSLTGALNRASFFRRLQTEVRLARLHSAELSLLMLDVDLFKQVNDTKGHAAGDDLLRALGRELSRTVRACDAIGRYGGEEFVILGRATNHREAIRLAERVRMTIARTMPITVSIGVASASEVAVDDGTSLCELADRRVYLAKRAGRNRVVG